MVNKNVIVILVVMMTSGFSQDEFKDPFSEPSKYFEHKEMVVESSRFDVGVSISIRNKNVEKALRFLEVKDKVLDPESVGSEVPLLVITVSDGESVLIMKRFIYLGKSDGYFSENDVNQFFEQAGLEFIKLFE